MSLILSLETSTAVLSVALARDKAVVAERICTEPRQHAALTAPLVKEVLQEAGVGMREVDAVCVSAGPGSYTGLRVGVSTAKGLAFGAGIPLLSVGTLDVLVSGVIGAAPGEAAYLYIIPLIDARRMEVYTAVFTPDGQRVTPVSASVVTEDSFAPWLSQGPVLFVGDGALKCKDVLQHPNAFFREAAPLARDMAPLAYKAFEAGKFEDLAYFEPFYLKDFVATVSKKQLW